MKFGYGGYEEDFNIKNYKLIKNYEIYNDTIIVNYFDDDTNIIPFSLENLEKIENEMLRQAVERKNSDLLKIAESKKMQSILKIAIYSYFSINILFCISIFYREKIKDMVGWDTLIFLLNLYNLKNAYDDYTHYKELIDELNKYELFLNINDNLQEKNKTLPFGINDVDDMTIKEFKQIDKQITLK